MDLVIHSYWYMHQILEQIPADIKGALCPYKFRGLRELSHAHGCVHPTYPDTQVAAVDESTATSQVWTEANVLGRWAYLNSH